jgi:cytochrome c
MRWISWIALGVAAATFGGAVAFGPPQIAHAQAAPANAMRGKILFLRCSSCHAINADAPPKIGPNLAGVVGRKAGTLSGYGYSAALKGKGFVWDDAMLDLWLTNPGKVVPGTSMAFPGFANGADRQAVIAYLKSVSR